MPPSPPHPPSNFVGRGDEIDRLLSTLMSRSPDAPVPVVIVVGEAGMGKSTLLAEAEARIQAHGGHLVLHAASDAAELELDFGVADQLVMQGGGRALRTAGTGRFEVGARLVQLSDGAGERRLLVVVDDAQVADEPSLQALAFAARRLSADRAAMIIATRPEGLRRLPPGLTRLAENGVITLTGFDLDDVHRLAAALRGRTPRPGSVERVHRHTGGHPLHTRLLLENADGAQSRELSAPFAPTLNRLLMERLVACSPDATRLLQALAVLDEPSSVDAAAAVAGIDVPLDAIVELTEAGLVDVDLTGPTLLAPRHRLVQEVTYDDLDAATRIAMHDRAALLTAGQASLRHRVAAATAPDPELAADLIAQAETDLRGGAPHLAAERLHTAASFSSPQRREELILRAADRLLALGRLSPERASEVAELPVSGLRSSVLGRAAMTSGRFGEAKRLLESAWEQTDDPAERATIAETLSMIGLSNLDPDAVVHWGEQVEQTGAAALSITMICHGLTMRGEFAAALVRADQAVRQASPSGFAAVDAQLARGIVSAWSNRLEDARRDLSAVLGDSSERSLMQALSARAHLSDVLLRGGQLVAAADMATEAVQLLDADQAGWLGPLPHSIAAYVHTAAGDFDLAVQHASIASEYARVTGYAPAMSWVEGAWLRLADARGDVADAVEIGDRMHAAGLDAVAEGINPWRAAYIESLVAVERLDDAAAVLGELDRHVGDDVSIATDAARARAALALAAGDRDVALAAFEEGLALNAGRARPLPRARLELAAGAFLRRNGRRTAAAEHLQHAARRLEQMGALPWQDRCARELASCGLRPLKRSSPRAAAELTAQERTIARLVAEGRSNRQVADELYVSVKTVEHHLSRVYSKLGVRGRVQMAAALSDALG